GVTACAPGPDDAAASDTDVRAETAAAERSDEPRSDVPTSDQEAPNTLTAAERQAGWRLLFDGETTDGWRGYMMDEVPDGWTVEDGLLTRSGPGRDIVTVERYADFELAAEWRLEPGGNSGILYRVVEGPEQTYHSGPEMQVLDDARHPDGGSPLTSAGANYGLHPAPRGVVRPAGEWNQARILVDGNHVEHWLNGEKIVEYELGSDDWERRVAESKFAAWPPYGRADEGHIALQDHGDRVWYRNVKIRVIE
ncbi:MAG TPA: DUF1080 domain-containing protein, partial [Longimicrobiales bacterium]|nr:DUF1080 domain-containing protein [Longimicrobiales bacterium]